jgi:FkbM family methyltransferase
MMWRISIASLIRAPLRAIPASARLPILSGGARGMLWIRGASVNSCWLGTYERSLQQTIASVVEPGTVAFDLGAHAGFFTLVFSRAVGGGSVVAFEPNPRNLKYLEAHIRINRVENVRVSPIAVSDESGFLPFLPAAASQMGRLDPRGTLMVRAVRLDDLVQSGEVPAPQYIKIDVEGAEPNVLAGAESVLDLHKPILFLATHGQEPRERSFNILRRLGYAFRPIGDSHDDFLATAGR